MLLEQRMSLLPSLQTLSLPTAHLFYLASLCSLESGPLPSAFPTAVRNQRWQIRSRKVKMNNVGSIWLLRVEKHLCPAEIQTWIAPWEKLNSSTSAFQLQRKATSPFFNQQEQKRRLLERVWFQISEGWVLWEGCFAYYEIACIKSKTKGKPQSRGSFVEFQNGKSVR